MAEFLNGLQQMLLNSPGIQQLNIDLLNEGSHHKQGTIMVLAGTEDQIIK